METSIIEKGIDGAIELSDKGSLGAFFVVIMFLCFVLFLFYKLVKDERKSNREFIKSQNESNQLFFKNQVEQNDKNNQVLIEYVRDTMKSLTDFAKVTAKEHTQVQNENQQILEIIKEIVKSIDEIKNKVK